MSVKVRPWPGSPTTASLTLSAAHDEADSLPADREVRAWLDDIRAMGYRAVRTGAVGPGVAGRLAGLGFVPVQELELLSADLQAVPPPPMPKPVVVVSRAWLASPRLVGRVLRVDRRAFAEGWCMDAPALRDARRATSHSALWTARDRDGTVGFVLVGRTGTSGYVQRLAVDPLRQRHGIAFELLASAHAWLRSNGCSVAFVNTEPTNLPALTLYRRSGYAPLSYRLQVLECDLSGTVLP